MSAIVDHVIAQVVGLEIRLLACQARLQAHTDPEALHDLRTSVRRLRSLIRPLRGLPGVDQLEDAAKAVGQLTTPLRDREVLAAHLAKQGHEQAAARRVELMHGVFAQVAAAPEVERLARVVDGFPRFARAAQRQKLLRGLKGTIDKRLGKQWKKLAEALKDPAHDRHRLRLLIKRVRYAAEAYPQLDQLPAEVMARLKKAQGTLGDWHDLWQWLLRAQQEADLQPCVAGWQLSLKRAEQRCDKTLDKLLAAIV
ncbi:CHAD domain-containing protein [Pseudomonas abieticivorans]|uniref:CHAD domain-containing protein n=1 Tax=Pseudomonas abieticivorans TaxID=2931382 RepID=UPI0020C06A2E|nr:CHAD domain-containing protein [Pseudomonas sp. PIA16]